MTLLSVVQNVCLVVGLAKPDQVAASTDREMQEMMRVANEVAIRIRDAEFDWQALQVQTTLTGDGTAVDFNLPEDYARMPTKASIWSSRWSWSLQQVPSTDAWLELQAVPVMAVVGRWITFADQMHILPAMATGETAKFFYISGLIVKPSNGSNKALFDADTDTFRLSERVLELGMIWQWRSQKGQLGQDDEDNYSRALYTAMNNDNGSKPIVSGNARVRFRDARTAFPYTVGN
jgi:hypothetical protein